MDPFDADYFARLERLHRLGRRAVPRSRRRPRARPRPPAAGGVIFAGHRDHAAGDPVGEIDWNAYARVERLFVKLREPEREQRLWLLLDASASTGVGEPGARPFDLLRRIALALGTLALRRGAAVGAYALGGGAAEGAGGRPPRWLSGRRGSAQAGRLKSFLLRLAPAGGLDPERTIAPFVRAVPPQRRGLAVVVSDFLVGPEPEELLTPLVRGGFELVAVELVDEAGFGRPAPPAREGPLPVRLRDAERDRSLALVVDDALAAGHARLRRERAGALARFCRARGIERVAIAPGEPFEEAVLDALALGVVC